MKSEALNEERYENISIQNAIMLYARRRPHSDAQTMLALRSLEADLTSSRNVWKTHELAMERD